MEFNEIDKYPLLSFITWNMLALSSVLVTLQFLLVEYKNLVDIVSLNLSLFSKSGSPVLGWVEIIFPFDINLLHLCERWCVCTVCTFAHVQNIQLCDGS